MAGREKRGVVSYEEVEPGYLEGRRLRKSAGWVQLWALGVGAVISGDFFGWNYGLAAGGFGGLALATVAMAAMYVCMVFSIAELSAALPHAGGFYSFTRSAFGPLGGYICGVTDTIEYVITPAVIVFSIGAYLAEIVPGVPAAAWWVIGYGIFTGINILGVELTFRVGLAVTALAVFVLAVFYASAVLSGAFRWDLLLNVPPDAPGGSRWVPRGWFGVFAALPFAIWFYLAIEQLPLAAEESHDAPRDMPRALVLGIATLLVLSLLTLVLNPGVGGGAAALAGSPAPLTDGFRATLGEGPLLGLFTVLAVAGLVASLHTIIYAYGRVLFSLSRAGYFPRWISRTNRRGAPHFALVLGAAAGLASTVAISLFEKEAVGAALLSMAVFGAVISYTMVMASFIVLRLRRPDLERSYRSPLGIPGAACGAALSVVAFLACFADEAIRPAVWGVAIFLGLAVLYFLLYSRHRLVAEAPEEAVARAAPEESRAGPAPLVKEGKDSA